ncbi:MAG TPA: glucose-6-phosphate dehydrogenase assembly protein OpcA [Candidatus Dormibacteraeota bacterium]|nr:glucose-6-phosphate dehydrogenase assembly protein OpcA [Candidatus Dormibacteraeota bacterium]
MTPAGAPVRTGHASGLHAVTRELAAMRGELLRSGGGDQAVRLSVLTLVVACADTAVAVEAVGTVERMAGSHPTRAIVVIAEPDAPPRLDADLSIHCSAKRGDQVCVELVQLEVGGETAFHLRSVVEPLLLPDVPVLLWLAGAPRLDQALSPGTLELCERLILDSDAYPDPVPVLTALAQTAAAPGRVKPVGDLAWSRVRPWRELLGRAFDTPELRGFAQGVELAEIQSAGASPGAGALLLAAWLRSRLDRPGFTVPEVQHITGAGAGTGVVGMTVHAHRRDRVGRVEIRDDGGHRVTTVTVEGVMRGLSSTWTVAAETPSLAELVGGELQEQGADPLYAAALRTVAAAR